MRIDWESEIKFKGVSYWVQADYDLFGIDVLPEITAVRVYNGDKEVTPDPAMADKIAEFIHQDVYYNK